jgi:hypothetical protein
MIGKVIYQLLRFDSAVYAVVGDKIFPMYADAKAAAPYITFDIISNVPNRVKGETSVIDDFRVQINCIATTYDAVADLCAKVRTRLDSYTGEAATGLPYMVNVLFDGENDLLHDEDLYGRAIDYIFRMRKITN